MTRKIAGFGWVRDVPDHRDLLYSAKLVTIQQLPSSVDLRPQCPPVYNQGRIGSCTANAIAGAVQFDRKKVKQTPDFIPSRLFIYYNERAIENRVNFDSGAQIRDGIKTLVKQGVCPEADWPYDDTPPAQDGGPFPPGARDGQQPPANCYVIAKEYRAANYQRVAQSLTQMKAAIAEGYPLVFGFMVYSSFFQAPGQQKTVIPMPGTADAVEGGHAVIGVGYDDAKSWFILRNSWGPNQGDKGYFYMPYSYLMDPALASDFWTIRTMAD